MKRHWSAIDAARAEMRRLRPLHNNPKANHNMKHIVLTVLVCLNVAAFAATYLRATEIVTRAIVEACRRYRCLPNAQRLDISSERSWIRACISSL